MQRNIVALADEEYDAITGPFVEEACGLVREIGKHRAYLVPAIIKILKQYACKPDDSRGDRDDSASEPRQLHRPHFRIHSPDR